MVCLSQASASASKSIYPRLLEGVKLHSTLTLGEGILSPEVRNGEQEAYHSWRSDERYSFELPNNHLCHTGCLCKASLFWTRVDYLPRCLARQIIFCQLKWYTKTWSRSPATPQTFGNGSGSSSRMAEVGLYLAWAVSFFTLCSHRFFSAPHHPFIVGTSGWRTLGKNFISWDCRKGYFSGLQKKGSGSKYPGMHIVTTALFAYKPIVDQRNWKIMAIYPSLSLPPAAPLLAKQLNSLHCFKFNACRWFYLEFVLLVRQASSVY